MISIRLIMKKLLLTIWDTDTTITGFGGTCVWSTVELYRTCSAPCHWCSTSTSTPGKQQTAAMRLIAFGKIISYKRDQIMGAPMIKESIDCKYPWYYNQLRSLRISSVCTAEAARVCSPELQTQRVRVYVSCCFVLYYCQSTNTFKRNLDKNTFTTGSVYINFI